MDQDLQAILVGVFLMAVGVFTFAGASWRWGFFIRSRKTRQMEGLLGVEGARWFHIVLGIGFLCLGVVVLAVVAAKR